MQIFSFKTYSVLSLNAPLRILLSFRKGVRQPRFGQAEKTCYTMTCFGVEMVIYSPEVFRYSLFLLRERDPSAATWASSPQKRTETTRSLNPGHQAPVSNSPRSRTRLDAVLDFNQWPEGRSTCASWYEVLFLTDLTGRPLSVLAYWKAKTTLEV